MSLNEQIPKWLRMWEKYGDVDYGYGLSMVSQHTEVDGYKELNDWAEKYMEENDQADFFAQVISWIGKNRAWDEYGEFFFHDNTARFIKTDLIPYFLNE